MDMTAVPFTKTHSTSHVEASLSRKTATRATLTATGTARQPRALRRGCELTSAIVRLQRSKSQPSRLARLIRRFVSVLAGHNDVIGAILVVDHPHLFVA